MHGQQLAGGEGVGVNDRGHELGLCGVQCREGGCSHDPDGDRRRPGNPSVGVIQTFGGPKGKFVDPPNNGTGIYKTCSDAPKAPPPA